MSYTNWQQLACNINNYANFNQVIVDCEFTIWDAGNVPNKVADLRKQP